MEKASEDREDASFQIVFANGFSLLMLTTHTFGRNSCQQNNSDGGAGGRQHTSSQIKSTIMFVSDWRRFWKGSFHSDEEATCCRFPCYVFQSYFPSLLPYPTWHHGSGNPQLL